MSKRPFIAVMFINKDGAITPLLHCCNAHSEDEARGNAVRALFNSAPNVSMTRIEVVDVQQMTKDLQTADMEAEAAMQGTIDATARALNERRGAGFPDTVVQPPVMAQFSIPDELKHKG